jgi:hypothetical protein
LIGLAQDHVQYQRLFLSVLNLQVLLADISSTEIYYKFQILK